VFLDCPAGYSLLTAGILRAAETLLVPTIPTVLSLRTVAQLVKLADRVDSPSLLAPFFSMVDRRKSLHRRICEWSADCPEGFLGAQVPYASVVEQMATRRMPLGAFAGRESATMAFADVWRALQARLAEPSLQPRERRARLAAGIESLIARLEAGDWRESPGSREAGAGGAVTEATTRPGPVHFVHSFDTDRRDLKRWGYVVELLECGGSFSILAGRSAQGGGAEATRRVEVRIDRWWAMQILSGVISPVAALERLMDRATSPVAGSVRAMVGDQELRRIESRVAGPCVAHPESLPPEGSTAAPSGNGQADELASPVRRVFPRPANTWT
jgi:hypothetical protein